MGRLALLRQQLDVVRSRAFRALNHVKLDTLAFGERLEALSLNSAKVHEDILLTARHLDETEAFLVVEPLHCS